jgi:hypothetical protein
MIIARLTGFIAAAPIAWKALKPISQLMPGQPVSEAIVGESAHNKDPRLKIIIPTSNRISCFGRYASPLANTAYKIPDCLKHTMCCFPAFQKEGSIFYTERSRELMPSHPRAKNLHLDLVWTVLCTETLCPIYSSARLWLSFVSQRTREQVRLWLTPQRLSSLFFLLRCDTGCCCIFEGNGLLVQCSPHHCPIPSPLHVFSRHMIQAT